MGHSKHGSSGSAQSSSTNNTYPPVVKTPSNPPSMPQLDGNHMFTWRELSEADDLATAITVDCVLGFQTHKMFKEHPKLTRNQQKRIRAIMKEFPNRLDYEAVYKEIVDLCGATYLRKWASDERFKLHVFRFLYLFDPRSGVEIRACKRYAHESHVGAALYATATWEKDQRVNTVVGCIAELNLEEEISFLRPKENDFSVMFSSRKQCSQLWLGPAAYVNHDCRPNCQFNITCTGDCNMSMRVLRTIQPGEELLIFYGSHFFDQNNASCECCTCELLGNGHFSSLPPPPSANTSAEAARIHMDCEQPISTAATGGNQQSETTYSFRHTDSRLDRLKRTFSQVFMDQSGRHLRQSPRRTLRSSTAISTLLPDPKFLPSMYFRTHAATRRAVLEWQKNSERSLTQNAPVPPKRSRECNKKPCIASIPSPVVAEVHHQSASNVEDPAGSTLFVGKKNSSMTNLLEASDTSSTLAPPPPLLEDSELFEDEENQVLDGSRKRRRSRCASSRRRRRRSVIPSKPPALQMQMPLLEAESPEEEDDIPPSPAELMEEDSGSQAALATEPGITTTRIASEEDPLLGDVTPTSAGSGALRIRIQRVTEDEYRVLPPLEHHEYTPPSSPPVLTTAV